MNQAEEEALVEKHAPDCFDNPNCGDVRESFRLAIRAAVAQERERCAKVCEELMVGYYDHAKPPYERCAAAIRRGE